MFTKLEIALNSFYINSLDKVEYYWPKVIWALLVILIWIFISIAIYKFVMYLFKRFKIIELIDKLDIELEEDHPEKEKKGKKTKWKKYKVNSEGKEIPLVWESRLYQTMQKKIKIDRVVAKAIAYYLFLVFFRISISIIWITEVEEFLKELLLYLPSLFIAFIVWFFGIRFANFIYDVVYHALELTKQKTAKVIASGAKLIILFFTLMVVLDKVWIATEITNIILIWFISMLSIAGWLAFWLGWKETAKEIIDSFKK